MRLFVCLAAFALTSWPVAAQNLKLHHKYESLTRLSSNMAGSNAGLMSTRSLIASVMLVGEGEAPFDTHNIRVGPYRGIKSETLCGYFWTRNGQYQAQVQFKKDSENEGSGGVSDFTMSFDSEHQEELIKFNDTGVLAHARVADNCSSAGFQYLVPLYVPANPTKLEIVLETGSAEVAGNISASKGAEENVPADCQISQDIAGYECSVDLKTLRDGLPDMNNGAPYFFNAKVTKRGRVVNLNFEFVLPDLPDVSTN